MSARRLALLAAALVIAASETALWLQVRDALRGQAEIQRRVEAHRCSLPAAAPVPGLGDPMTYRMPDMPRLVQPVPMTEEA